MKTVMMPSKVEGGGMGAQAAMMPTCLATTLYDLIAAIQDVVGPEDDVLVVATVVHLLRSRQLTRMGPARASRPVAAPRVARTAGQS
jgi:hypothetical protein